MWYFIPMSLTRKQQAFVQELIKNPKQSAKAAAMKTYNVTTERSAEVVGSELLRKPEIKLELAKHSAQAEKTLLKVMNYSSEMGETFSKEGASYAAVAVSAAKDILDRVHGKATQRVESTSTSVNLNLSLTDIT